MHVQPQVKVFKEKPALLCLKIRLILFDLKKIINQYCYKLVTKYTITTSVLWFRTHVCALVDHRKYSHFIHVSRHTMFIIFIFYIIICFHVLQYIWINKIWYTRRFEQLIRSPIQTSKFRLQKFWFFKYNYQILSYL